jgi:hypothetical protein
LHDAVAAGGEPVARIRATLRKDARVTLFAAFEVDVFVPTLSAAFETAVVPLVVPVVALLVLFGVARVWVE